MNVANGFTYLFQNFKLQSSEIGSCRSHLCRKLGIGIVPATHGTGDLIEVAADFSVFGGQLPKRGKQLVVDRGDRDDGTDTCTLNGSADKLGLADSVGRKAGGKVRVFFLGHAGLDNMAAVGRVVPFAGHWLHLLSLIAVFGANLHPITGSNS